MSDTTALYRMYDRAERLLYVGITFDPSRRFPKHMHSKSWWDLVSVINIQRFPTRREALTAEAIAIEEEDPIFNLSRPNAQTNPGIVIRLATCGYCGVQFIDEIYPDSYPMDECTSCNESICYAYEAGRRWEEKRREVAHA